MTKLHFVLVEHVARMLNFRWRVHKVLPFILNRHWKACYCHHHGQNKCLVKWYWMDRMARAYWGSTLYLKLSPPARPFVDSVLMTMSLVTPHFEGPSAVLVALMVDKVSQTEFSPGTSMFSQYNSANAIYSLVHLLLKLHGLSNGQRHWIKDAICFRAHLNLSHFALQSWYSAMWLCPEPLRIYCGNEANKQLTARQTYGAFGCRALLSLFCYKREEIQIWPGCDLDILLLAMKLKWTSDKAYDLQLLSAISS